jgi:hypothetical protein
MMHYKIIKLHWDIFYKEIKPRYPAVVTVVNSQAAMLRSDAEVGGIIIRIDANKSFILRSDDPSVPSNWMESS